MKSFEEKLLGRLYCFCGGGDDGGNSGSEDEAAAEQRGYDMGGGGYTGADDFGFSDDTIGGYDGAGDIGGTEPGGGDDDRLAAEEAARQEAARQEAARQEAQRAREQREAEEREAARLEAEMAAEYARQESARQEAVRQEAERQEAERLAAEIARIEAEEAARFEAEMEAEAARQEAARKEAARQEAARRVAAKFEVQLAELARIEAEEAARQEAARQETERLAAEAEEQRRKDQDQEAREAEEARLSSLESLTDDQLDEAIATYSNADTAVASEVLSRLVEEKEIRTAEKAEEEVDGGVDDFNEGATTPADLAPGITGETTYIDEEAIKEAQKRVNERLASIGGEGTSERDTIVYAPEYWHYGVIESSDLPGSNVGISLGDLMKQYGVPADKITYGPTDIPVIDLGMTTEEIDAIYGGDDQPENPTTQQQIIDFVTEKAIKTLDANGDGKVSALEVAGAFAVGTSGGALGILSNVNTLANKLGITDRNIVNELISSVEEAIESAIGFAIPNAGAADLSDTALVNEVAKLQAGLISPAELEARANELGYAYNGKRLNVLIGSDEKELEEQSKRPGIPFDLGAEKPLEDILAFFDKTPSGEVTSTGGSPDTTTDGDPITTGVATSGGGDDEPGATGADDISGSPVGTTGPGTDAGITDTTGSGASPTTGASPDTTVDITGTDIPVIDLGMTTEEIDAISGTGPSDTSPDTTTGTDIPVIDLGMTPDEIAAIVDPITGSTPVSIDEIPSDTLPTDIPGGPFSELPDSVGSVGPTGPGATDTTGSGASPTTGTDTTTGTDITTGTDTTTGTDITTGTDMSMDTYIPYYTPDGVVDVFVGTPGEFADLAVANNWTAITSMGTDSTTTDVNAGPTTTDVNIGPTTIGPTTIGPTTAEGGQGGQGGEGGQGGQGGLGGYSDVNIGPTTIDINLLPDPIVKLIEDYYSDDDDDAVAPVEYTPAAYAFGEPTTFTPTQDLTYREPAITSPFDFARDFGYYTLSPEIADSYATKELQSYMPTYLQPIGEMTPEEIEASRGIRSIIGPKYPVQTQPIGYPFTTTPEEEAEALLPKE